MNSINKTARITGILFILATVTGVLSVVFAGPFLNTPDNLGGFFVHKNQVTIAALLEIIMAFSCAGIAISMYPVLKHFNAGLALGAVGFRIIEATIYIVGAINLLLLLPLSREFVKAGSPVSSYFQSMGSELLAGHELCMPLAGKLAWCAAALMYYSLFFQTNLVPRWLSGWGIAGIILAIAASIPFVFHLTNSFSTIDTVLHLPIGLQEIVLAVWLIVKGFNPSFHHRVYLPIRIRR